MSEPSVCVLFETCSVAPNPTIIVQQNLPKDPAQYELTLEQMVMNGYPIPSYMADVFEKPEGWVETPQPPESDPNVSQGILRTKVYAIDCEMVRNFWFLYEDFSLHVLVHDRRRKRALACLHNRLFDGSPNLRPASEALKANHRLFNEVCVLLLPKFRP